ncbi:hypothetical protein D9M69_604940 [compost metagenome]
MQKHGDPVGDISLTDPIQRQRHTWMQSDRRSFKLHLAPASIGPSSFDSRRIRSLPVYAGFGPEPPERLHSRIEPAIARPIHGAGQ